MPIGQNQLLAALSDFPKIGGVSLSRIAFGYRQTFVSRDNGIACELFEVTSYKDHRTADCCKPIPGKLVNGKKCHGIWAKSPMVQEILTKNMVKSGTRIANWLNR